MESKTNQSALFTLTTVFFFWGFIAAGNSVFSWILQGIL